MIVTRTLRKDGTIKVAGLIYQCPLLEPYLSYLGKRVTIVYFRQRINYKQEPGELHIMFGDEKVVVIAYGKHHRL